MKKFTVKKFTVKRVGTLVLIVGVAIYGAIGGWKYNATEPLRAADDSAVIRTAADPSVILTTHVPVYNGYLAVTMPFRNDSPYTIQLASLIMPFATQLTWDGMPLTLQPGETGYPVVEVPANCLAGFPAAGSGPARTPPPTRPSGVSDLPAVYMKVTTVDGKTHGITLGANGALEAASWACGQSDPNK